MYRQLDATRIENTVTTLSGRVARRFPQSGLSKVAKELATIGTESMMTAEALGRPIHLLRVGVWVCIGGIVVIAVAPFLILNTATMFSDFGEFVQVVEAGVNDVVFLAVGIFFLATLETRIKRRRALRKLRELRSVAHIVDMHQLSKDPEQLLSPGDDNSIDGPILSRADLAKYLDYCSELLSLTSKVAALYIQNLDDPVVLESVTKIENLTTGLSRKIWQKIMILDTIVEPAGQR
jgi:hypothetical protein